MIKSKLFFVIAALLALASYFADSKPQSPPSFVSTPAQSIAGNDTATDNSAASFTGKTSHLFRLLETALNQHDKRAKDFPFEDD